MKKKKTKKKKVEDFVHSFGRSARLIGQSANRWAVDVGDPDVAIEIWCREDFWVIDFQVSMHRRRKKWAATTVSLLVEADDLEKAIETFRKHLSDLCRKVQLFDFANQ